MNATEQKRQRINRSLTLLGSGMLFMMGWNFGNAALLLTGVFIPAFSFCCALIVMQQRKLIRVRRVCVDGACEGERVEVKLTIQNRHWFPIFRLLVEDHFEPEMEAEQYFSLPGVLPPHSATEFHYNAECYLDRGRYTLGPVNVQLADPLDIFIFSQRLDVRQPFSVFPHVYDMPASPPGIGTPDAIPEGLPRARAGDSDLQLGVREYVPGDPYRHVHWPQTARAGELMVREYEQITPANTYLLLDLSLAGRAGTGKFSTEEYGVQLVASLAAKTIHGGQPAGVLINSEPQIFIEMDYGHQHLVGILDALIPVRETSNETLYRQLQAHPEIIRDGSTFWLILRRTNFTIAELDELLELFAWKPCQVFLVIIDDEGMVAFETTPQERAQRPDRHALAAEIGDRVDSVWWVDLEQGLEQAMKGGPL
ncbi:DUF58 domain-containing protein [Cerasicoccus fimbriatus]|uniref:DUF58 domain-containing protein n=1 Tax=Cerasicoccus fimbriatus TaxID=3014554 RepID=UPI0022B31814|nr:DUF58 domain-containing protein [Cerasicoccus sp. TK19100]